VDRKFLDVNAVAVFLDESHLGHVCIRDAVLPGFRGAFQLVLSASILIRAGRVLVSQWGVDATAADNALQDIARARAPVYVRGEGATVMRVIEPSREVSHDIYDCFVIALAEAGGATHLITRDVGLKPVCQAAGLEYENPVPRDVLSRFGASGRNPE
jgi:hypothetical protein